MTESTDVLIVGAGPVGLILANDLGRRGVSCIVVERRPQNDVHPKMELCNSRSMEILARLGLEPSIRERGWPSSAPMDVLITRSLAESALVHLRYPSIDESRNHILARQGLGTPRTPYQRISQYTLEPLLREHAEQYDAVQVRFGQALQSLQQGPESVLSTVWSAGGDQSTIRSKFLVGCDGGGSTVRRQLGIKLEGTPAVRQMFMVFFRDEHLLQRNCLPVARHYYIANKRHCTLVAQDDLKRWAFHCEIPTEEELDTIDPVRLVEECLGVDLEAEIIHAGPWSPHLLVADSYGRGRVWLAGDSAHQYIPTGGFGMNTGVGDADALGWRLGALCQGWGRRSLLEGYAEERRSVGLRNRAASGYAAQGVKQWRTLYAQRPDDPGVVAQMEHLQRRSHEMHGIESGYVYNHASLVAETCDQADYRAEVVVGGRLPHQWIAPGVSAVDLASAGFSLFMCADRPPAGVRALLEAARAQGLPLEVVPLPSSAMDTYGAAGILVRPDLHIVWTGADATDAIEALESAIGIATTVA